MSHQWGGMSKQLRRGCPNLYFLKKTLFLWYTNIRKNIDTVVTDYGRRLQSLYVFLHHIVNIGDSLLKKEKISDRKIKAIETKKKIYESAYQLFKQYGIEKVSVDSIVEMAGVSKGAFYVHFESKYSLIAAIIADFVDRLDLDYKSYLQSFPDDMLASEILSSLAGKIAEILSGTIGYDLMKIAYEVLLSGTISPDIIAGYDRDLYKLFSDVISKGLQQGEFRTDMSPDTITKHCILAIRGLTYEWCIRYPDFDLKAQVLQHFEILLTGIKK